MCWCSCQRWKSIGRIIDRAGEESRYRVDEYRSVRFPWRASNIPTLLFEPKWWTKGFEERWGRLIFIERFVSEFEVESNEAVLTRNSSHRWPSSKSNVPLAWIVKRFKWSNFFTHRSADSNDTVIPTNTNRAHQSCSNTFLLLPAKWRVRWVRQWERCSRLINDSWCLPSMNRWRWVIKDP